MKILQHQWKVFCSAVMFLTRIPVPNYEPYNPKWLQQSPRYFTYVGAVVGLLSGIVCIACFLIGNVYLAAIAYTISSILITGAFHEDGFADMCDAFGGGYTIEKKLTIMKDSRLGTYGALGLFLIVILKIFLVAEILNNYLALAHIFNLNITAYKLFCFLPIAVLVHTISRFAPLLIMQNLKYVADVDASKSKPMANQKLPIKSLIIAILPGILFAFILPQFTIIALAGTLIASLYMAWLCKKHLGGYTGDCLGATQQLTEITIYLQLVILLNTII